MKNIKDNHNIFLISDLHSNAKGLKKALVNIKSSKDKIYILGDLFDRGYETQELLDIIDSDYNKELEKYNHLIFLMGNHDDMLYHALELYESSSFRHLLLKSGFSKNSMVSSFIANDKGNRTLYALCNNTCKKLGKFNPNLLHDKTFLKAITAENKENFQKLKRILNSTILFKEYKVDNWIVRLSHTGSSTETPDLNNMKNNFYWCLEPSKEVLNYRNKNNIIDFSGHWSYINLIKFLQDKSISFALLGEEKSKDSIFDKAIFVPDWNQVFIDNGHGDNIINLNNAMKKIINKKYKIVDFYINFQY